MLVGCGLAACSGVDVWGDSDVVCSVDVCSVAVCSVVGLADTVLCKVVSVVISVSATAFSSTGSSSWICSSVNKVVIYEQV